MTDQIFPQAERIQQSYRATAEAIRAFMRLLQGKMLGDQMAAG